tara:strand:- start:53 stop:838 length:786 start_codon:yes stop_codon:yes gene_type:complete
MGIGSVLGGIAGLLIPGGGALFSSIGSGLGSLLIDKESPKDAIKSALLAGAGAKLFGTGITSSAMGQSAQKGLARLGVGTSAGIENVLGAAAAPTAAAVANAPAIAGGLSAGQLYGGLTALSAVSDMTRQPNVAPTKYFSYHTGSPFDTEAEARAEDRKFEARNNMSYEENNLPAPTTFHSSGRISGGYAQGGYIEGPGTGTSDSIPAVIKQGGVPVQEALLSDGEFVMTEAAVKGAGNGNRKQGAANMYAMMRDFERGQA